MKTTRFHQQAVDAIDAAERELETFLAENDENKTGRWTAETEAEYQRLAAKVEGLYYEFDVPEIDRMYV